MIPKPNSLTLMNMIDETVERAKRIESDLADIKKQTETKLAILNTCYAVANQTLESLENAVTEKARQEDTVVFALDANKVKGNRVIGSQGYTQYGQTAHASFVSLPSQVFNILTDTGPIFKDNGTVKFITEENGEDYKYRYCNILKQESDPSKEDVFHIFSTGQVTLRIETQPSHLIGGARCNMVELCPYLPGTFSIREIRVWTIDQYLSNDLDVPAYISPESVSYNNLGAARFYLDAADHRTLQIYRVEFDLIIQQQENGYPFGLKHIYFYDADMDTANSYIIVKIEKDSYIGSVSRTVTVTTPEGRATVQPKQYGYSDDPDNYIRFYMLYENGLLQNELVYDNAIARNITSFYVKIPLFKPIKAISFNDVTTR